MVGKDNMQDVDETEGEQEKSGTVQSDSVETEEETRIPLSYDTAEEALLSMFIQDEDVATLIAQSGLNENHFSKRKNKRLYPILLDTRLQRGACNYDLIVDSCEKEILQDGRSLLEDIGGLKEITKLMIAAPEVIDLKVAQAYIDLILEQYRLVKVQDLARWITSQKKFDEAKIVEKISSIQQILLENVTSYGLAGLDELLLDSYSRFKDRKINPEKYVGVQTGFYWLDKNRAIAKKRVCVIGARTNVGKSVFVSNIATSMLLSDYKVLLFTPELDKEEYVDRLICAYSGVSKDRWKEATVDNAEVEKLSAYRDKLISTAPRNLFIEDRGSQTCSFILSSVKRHMLNHKVDVVIVDYLQKLKYYGENTKRAITDIMEKFCSFAKDNDIAFVIVSQLRRSDESEPQMNELKESGDIENFADSVVLLHRNSTVKMGERVKGWYKIAKHRQGLNTDNVELRFDDTTLKFSEVNIPEEGVTEYNSWFDSDEEEDTSEKQHELLGSN